MKPSRSRDGQPHQVRSEERRRSFERARTLAGEVLGRDGERRDANESKQAVEAPDEEGRPDVGIASNVAGMDEGADQQDPIVRLSKLGSIYEM
jgi:hypothetical protein